MNSSPFALGNPVEDGAVVEVVDVELVVLVEVVEAFVVVLVVDEVVVVVVPVAVDVERINTRDSHVVLITLTCDALAIPLVLILTDPPRLASRGACITTSTTLSVWCNLGRDQTREKQYCQRLHSVHFRTWMGYSVKLRSFYFSLLS